MQVYGLCAQAITIAKSPGFRPRKTNNLITSTKGKTVEIDTLAVSSSICGNFWRRTCRGSCCRLQSRTEKVTSCYINNKRKRCLQLK